MATMTRPRTDTGVWVKHGVIGGIIAGVVFAMFEMIMAAVLMGTGAFFMPLRMIGAIVLGQQALAPTYPLVTAGAVGIILHMMFAIVFGVVFALIASAVPPLRESSGALVVAASVFGLLLWVVNFYVIAPAAGWVWFPQQSSAVVQFVAHTFMYGTVLGLYLDRTAARAGMED